MQLIFEPLGLITVKQIANIYLKFGLVICLLFAGISAKADHIIGSDITYTSSDTAGIYYITFNFYRDCNGCYVLGQSPKCGTSENCNSSSTAPTSLTVYCKSSGATRGTVSLKRTSIVDITTTCNSSRSRCEQPCNGTFPYGIEKHTFKGRADLRNALNGCCELEIGVLLYVRNVGITTGQRQQSFYTSCDINACKEKFNSSPALTNDPVAILCCNQPYTFNNGAVDTTDFDSISYEFAPAYRGKGQLCSYSGTRSYLDPISTYYPGSLKFPYKNPQASPPIGTSLDPVTGDLIFTPVNCSEIAVVVIQMTEWRKDSTGKYNKVGVTRRDMQFIVMNCPENNPPEVDGPYNYNVCEGSEICFNITTDDKVYVPPPPAPTPDPDTVRISWNRGIPGATFTVTNPTARLQTGRFCWTPLIGQASDLPYTFTVTARDNACPLNAVTVRSFRVKVKPKAEAERNIDTLPCGVYTVDAIPSAGFRGTPSHRWQILDSNRNIVVNRRIAKFASTGAFLSVQKSDTIEFRRGGMYIIQHTVNNMPNNCPTTYYDTLVVPPLLEANLSLGKDTFICAGTTLRLEPYISNAAPPISFIWSTMGIENDGTIINNATTQPGDTLTYFDLTLPEFQYDTAVSIYVTDASGCRSEDTIQVFQKQNPVVSMPQDPRICSYDSIKIVPTYDTAFWIEPTNGDTLRQGDTLLKQWFLNGAQIPFATDDSLVLNIRGEYILRVSDSLGCYAEDTLNLFVNDTVTADAGPDQVLCFNDSLVILAGGLDTASNGKSGGYIWYDISTSAPIDLNRGTDDAIRKIADIDTRYRLYLEVTEGGVTCLDDDSVFIDVNPLPEIDLRADYNVCCQSGNVSMLFNVITPASSEAGNGLWEVPTQPSWMTGHTFHADSACGPSSQPVTLWYTYQNPSTSCINADSMVITVDPLPEIAFKDKIFCQDINEINLADELLTRPSPASINLGTPSWDCIECNGNNFTNMLDDRGVAGIPNYWLLIDESTYKLKNDRIDTVTLEFTFTNQFGCRRVDTVSFEIWEVPKIKFEAGRDLCWDEGDFDLNTLFDVNWNDGFWSMQNLAGYRDSLELGGILDSSHINTFNSVELANESTTPNAFYLRYNHYATGCYAFNDTTLVINPRPDISITPLKAAYCDAEPDEALLATPAGGDWSSTVPASIVGGSTFSPGSVPQADKNKDIWLYYYYQSPNTGCDERDSIMTFVEASPTIDIIDDEIHVCKPDDVNTIDIDITSTHDNVINPLTWGVVPLSGQSGTYSTTSDSSITATFTVANDTSHRFFVSVSTGNGAQCPADDDLVFVNIHPVPDFTIEPTVPNGCNPVETDFIVTFNNKVLPSATNAYFWDLGNSTTSTLANPLATYNVNGDNLITLTFTSDRGCDADATTNVEVYPLPIAAFTPDPNNFTTAALPRFSFTDDSEVDPVLGSSIVSWNWDFNSPFAVPQTSTDQNPTTFYNTDTATYTVKLVVETNYGCKDSTTRNVIVGPDLIVYVPTGFTPDGNGPPENDEFKAIISGEKTMELIIFNRWGEIMFQTTDKDIEWDGTFQGAPCQQDVYAYQLKVTALNDEVYQYSGTITLLR